MRTLSLSAAVIGIAATAVLSAQVPVNREPHTKVLLYTNFIRILDETIPPGDSEMDHTHGQDIVTLVLGNATTRTRKAGEDWGAPRMEAAGSVTFTQYTGAPAVHAVQNAGTTPYHAIAVENNRDKGWPMVDPVMAPGTMVMQATRSFIVYDVRLSAGTAMTHHNHTRAVVAVLLSGAVEQGGIGGEAPVRIQQAGQWFTLPPGQAHDLIAAGDGETHVIEIEVL